MNLSYFGDFSFQGKELNQVFKKSFFFFKGECRRIKGGGLKIIGR